MPDVQLDDILLDCEFVCVGKREKYPQAHFRGDDQAIPKKPLWIIELRAVHDASREDGLLRGDVFLRTTAHESFELGGRYNVSVVTTAPPDELPATPELADELPPPAVEESPETEPLVDDIAQANDDAGASEQESS